VFTSDGLGSITTLRPLMLGAPFRVDNPIAEIRASVVYKHGLISKTKLAVITRKGRKTNIATWAVTKCSVEQEHSKQ
jgi:hypothetical protein